MNLSLERGPPEAGKAIPMRACVPMAHSNPAPPTIQNQGVIGFADNSFLHFGLHLASLLPEKGGSKTTFESRNHRNAVCLEVFLPIRWFFK